MNLKDLIRPNIVEIDVEVKNWEDAIRAAGSLLVEDNAVEKRFTDAMIRVAKEFGPYIVVAPGIALPHALPEDGVIKASISVIRLKTPVNFGNKENDPVFLVIALAALDGKQHIEGLRELSLSLGNEDAIEKIRKAGSKKEILDYLLCREK